MKKTELKTGMLIQTEYGYWGVVEIENNQIDFCYRPRISKDKQIATLNEDFDKVQTDFYYRSFCGCESNDYQKVSLNEVFEFDDGKLGIGFTITEEMYKEHSEAFGEDPFFGKAVGDLIITEEFVAVYTLQQIDSF